jgi:histidine ammonia-lyase
MTNGKMTEVLNTRFDITLEMLERVAWQGAPLRIASVALGRIETRRKAFCALLAADPGARVYGVTVGQGEMAQQQMDEAEVARLARMKPLAAAVAAGKPYPERVVKGIVLARFANILDGHAAATPRLAEALVGLLNRGPLPQVSQSGQGGPGEILALYPLFATLSQSFELAPGERGALINGAPCGAALLADAALAARQRLALTVQVMALAIDAFNAPLEHYDPRLGELLGAPHHERAFAALAAWLSEKGEGATARDHQAPVSFRIIPALLAEAHWALGQAEEGAGAALSAVTHNPVYLPPEPGHPNGRCLSSGGFHNSLAAPLMDGLAAVWADLCLLCERLAVAFLNGRVSGFPDFLLQTRPGSPSDGHGAVGYLPMAIAGHLEEARAAAQRSFIPGSDASVFGQDDVASPVFLAWPKVARAGRSLDACLALLAVTASQAYHVTGRAESTPPLRGLLDAVRQFVPPIDEDRLLSGELAGLTSHFTGLVFAAEQERGAR